MPLLCLAPMATRDKLMCRRRLSSLLIPPSHRRRGATTVFGLNRHHHSDTASSFSWFSTTRHSCVFPRVAAEPQRCHCEHGDLIELQLRFDGGATAIMGGMTAVLAAALRGQ